VWAGNDDYQPTKRMTGGSLPAMTWRDIMAYAHQGIEAKPIPGVSGPTPPVPATAAAGANATADAMPRPALLTRRAADVLTRVERLFEDAARVMPEASDATTGQGASRATPSNATAERQATSAVRN
jgi:penicillin-binding protein 1A